MPIARVTIGGRTAEVSGETREEVEAAIEKLKQEYSANLPKMGLTESMITLVNQGATFGFSDEIAAGLQAVTEAPFSEKTVGDIYGEKLQVERDRLEAARQQRPKTSFSSEVLGGIATGGALFKLAGKAGATEALKRVPGWLKYVTGGAGAGGLYAAGVAEEERLKSAGVGAAVGAVTSPLAAGAVSIGTRIVKKLGQPLIRALQNTPKNQAERLIKEAMENGDIGEEFIQEELERLGPNATLADVADVFQRLARGTAARSGRGSTIASTFLRDRQAGAQQRLLGDTSTFKRWFQDFTTRRIDQADDLYRQAYDTPLQVTETMQTLMNRPSVKVAMGRAQRAMEESGGGGGHVRYFQTVKEELDDMIGSALRKGEKQQARRLIETRRMLLNEIDEQVPVYAQARATFAGEAQLRDAAELGRNMFSKRYDLTAVDVAIEAMEESEKQAFRMGAMRGLVDKIESMADNRNVGGKLIESPRAREVLRMVFPTDEAFDGFVRLAEAESRFSQTRNMVLGGSPTTRIAEDVSALNQGASMASAMAQGDPVMASISLIRNLGLGDVSQETLEEVANILFSQNLPQSTISRISPTVTTALPSAPGMIIGGTAATVNQEAQ